MTDKPSPENTPTTSSAYVSIDELRREHPVTVDRLAEFHGITLPSQHSQGEEIRMACPLHCGKKEVTANNAIAIRPDIRGFLWHCFHYGCGKGGNDIAFNDFLRDAQGTGKPRGARFKDNLKDYQQMAAGMKRRVMDASAPVEKKPESSDDEELEENVPLEENEKENIRALVDLPKKFLTDQGKMPPYAASYQRRRPWFQDVEWVLKEWGVGYLPKGTTGDRTGGTLRDKIVFPIRSRAGKVLAYCGRDPDWERKDERWRSFSEEKRKKETAPEKWRFPSRKLFRKGREVFGQDRLIAGECEEQLHEQGGLWIVEGPGDVINLSRAKILAVALMGIRATEQQLELLNELAWECAEGRIVPLFDLDEEGRKGMWQFVQKMAQRCYIRLGWTSEGGTAAWAGRQPEELSVEEMKQLREQVMVRPTKE